MELVVSLGIIMTLLGLSVAALQESRRRNTLRLGAQVVASALNEAQERALNGVKPANCVNAPASPDDLRACSHWGVAVNAGSREIVIFADANDNCSAGTDEIQRTLALPEGIAANTDAVIVFHSVPPVFEVYTNAGGACNGPIVSAQQLQVRNQARQTKNISVNPNGIVVVQ
jgi:Tfp pilus assembly protein FimT